VDRQADRFVVEFPPADARGPITCVVSAARDLGLRSALVLARDSATLPDPSHATVGDLSVAQNLPVVFLTLRRSGANPTRLAAFRDPQTSFVCLSPAGADPSAFQSVVIDLATSIRPAQQTGSTKLVRFCRLSLKDGSVGFERWQVNQSGALRTSVVNSSLLYRSGEGVDFMELDVGEKVHPNGTVDHAILVRAVGGTPELQSTIQHRGGESYDYELVTRQGPSSGRFRTKAPTGLPSLVAIADRIKRELVSGRSEGFSIEIWDPYSPRKEPSQMTLSLDSRQPPTIKVAQGERYSLQVVDEEGRTKRSETTLSGGDRLISQCETLMK
jgi:hypothetical protein